jgi:ribosomal-protein-alanine N-acetyltransferase
MLTTDRLLIRPFTIHDLAEFEKLLLMPEVPGWQIQRARSKAFLEWQISNYSRMDIVHGIVCFGIFDHQVGSILGAVGVGEHDDLHETEIFYNVLPEARGNGFATEAADAIAKWVFANYNVAYIIGTTEAGNIASERVLEKCGFSHEDERVLLVHIEGRKYNFRYYRLYRP